MRRVNNNLMCSHLQANSKMSADAHTCLTCASPSLYPQPTWSCIKCDPMELAQLKIAPKPTRGHCKNTRSESVPCGKRTDASLQWPAVSYVGGHFGRRRRHYQESVTSIGAARWSSVQRSNSVPHTNGPFVDETLKSRERAAKFQAFGANEKLHAAPLVARFLLLFAAA